MIPRDYRFTVYNSTGVTIPVSQLVVTARRYNFDSNGALVYENAGANAYTNVGSIANATFYVGSPALSNADSLWIGGHFLFAATLTVSGNGSLILSLQRSADGGTTFDSNSHGRFASVLSVVNSNAIAQSFEL